MWYCTYIENLGMGKLVANHTVKLLVTNNLVNMTVNEYAKYNFAIFGNIDEESLDEQLNDSPNSPIFSLTKIFPYTVLVDCYIRVIEELAGATDRQFWLISYLNSYTTKKLKNKTI